MEDKKLPETMNRFENTELVALLNQTQQEFVDSLGVTQQAIFDRLKCMIMIQNVGDCMPYELKSRDVEHFAFTCEQLL